MAQSGRVEKKSRKSISLADKMKVISSFESGQRAVDIARTLGLTPTTVRTIRSNANKIKSSIQNVSSLSSTKVNRTRSSIVENMEKLLALWIEDQNQRNVPVSLAVIQTKAKSLYDDLKAKEGGCSKEEQFTASRGWFQRFKIRYNFHNIKVTGESASSDTTAAEKFVPQFEKLVEEYSPKQVFNVDETGIFWKRMPARTYISQEEKHAPGFKAAKDRVTLLVGGNASGDYKMKPLLVHRSANPRALKGYSKAHLPVIYTSNKKAWITSALFTQWLSVHAIPEWREYCAKQNLEFKILLVIDNAPAHPSNINDLGNKNIKVVFLPPNTTALLQPMDQGAIAAFKAYYLRHTFSQLLTATDGEGKPTIREYWRSFNIRQAIDNISTAWNEVSEQCMNRVWRNLWPGCIKDVIADTGLDSCIVPSVNKETLNIAQEVGFVNLTYEDIEEVLASHMEELTNEELQELAQIPEEDEDEGLPERTLTTKGMSTAFRLIDEALNILAEEDPNRERNSKAERAVREGLSCYYELYKEKVKKNTKQTTLQSYFNKSAE